MSARFAVFMEAAASFFSFCHDGRVLGFVECPDPSVLALRLQAAHGGQRLKMVGRVVEELAKVVRRSHLSR